MWASSVSAPTRSARTSSVPEPLSVPPATFAPGLSPPASALARQHRFVHAAAALDDDAVHRHALARPDAHHIADLHQFQRHVLFTAVGPHQARAVFGASLSNRRTAALVWPRARSSSTCPSSTSSTRTAAVSK